MIKDTLVDLAVIYAAHKENNHYHGLVFHANMIFVIPATRKKTIKRKCIQAITILLSILQMEKEEQTLEAHMSMDTAVIFVLQVLSKATGTALHANMISAMTAIRRRRSQFNNQFNKKLIKYLKWTFGVPSYYSLKCSKLSPSSKDYQATITNNSRTFPVFKILKCKVNLHCISSSRSLLSLKIQLTKV
jgi:hypothetical protein